MLRWIVRRKRSTTVRVIHIDDLLHEPRQDSRLLVADGFEKVAQAIRASLAAMDSKGFV